MGGLADLVIGVSGNIGSGKTTLIEYAQKPGFCEPLINLLSQNPSATKSITPLREEVTQEIIDAFYQDPKASAFLAQINFFNARLRREHIVDLTPGIVLVDRPIQEDYHVFGKAQRILGNMSHLEFRIYEENFREMTKRIPPPDVYLYLKAPLEVLQRNIVRRGRPEEQGMVADSTYLETLQNLYDDFFRNHAECPVVEIDTSQMDISSGERSTGGIDEAYLEKVLAYAAGEIRKLRTITKLTPRLGTWLSYNPTEAVVNSIRYESELRTYLHENQVLITLAGNIGLGKTAWGRILANGLQIDGIYELDAETDEINDELLRKFLGNKPKYCYDLQMHLLSKRLGLRRESAARRASSIEDRTPEEDPGVFHRLFRQQGYLTESQYDSLQIESRRAYRDSPPSDLMIMLQGSPELSWSRIVQRSRPEELIGGWELDKDLRPLARLYDEFPKIVSGYGLHRGPVLVFDVDRVDITSRAHQGFVYEQVLDALKHGRH